MKIQFNTDKNIDWSEKDQEFFSSRIIEEFIRFHSSLTRIEVHISDENGHKEGINDIRCLLEARLEGKNPIAVSCQEKNIESAVFGAIDKLKASLKTILGRVQHH